MWRIVCSVLKKVCVLNKVGHVLVFDQNYCL